MKIRRYFFGIFSLFLALFIALIAFIVIIEAQLPDVAVLKDVHMQTPLRIYSREGLLISEYGPTRLIPVTVDKVPNALIKAILSTEDQRFYSHPGVDFIGLFRAFKVLVGTGQKSQGASTITMQVARNFFLTHKKTYIRKIKEILLALKIERNFSKSKILELYLNKVYFGNRAYGVAAAASVYYGKNLDQLSLAEIAMIAGLPQAPSKHNPLAQPQEAVARRDHVLLRMLGVGALTPQQYQQAIHEPDHASYHGPQLAVNAPYIGEMVRQFLVEQYGEEIYDRGYSVYTTIAAPLQQVANQSLQRGLIDYTHRHGYHSTKQFLSKNRSDWRNVWQRHLAEMNLSSGYLQPAAVLAVNNQSGQALLADGQVVDMPWQGLSWAFPDATQASDIIKEGEIIWVRKVGQEGWLEALPKVQGAVVSIDPQTGAILALNGGFDYQLSKFNRVIQAQRQSGSSFKPFIYSAALDKGYTLASTFNDAPVVMNDSGMEKLWRPQNSSHQFYGMTRLREALIQSRNMVSIRLLQEIGLPFAIQYAQRFGFDSSQLPNSLSLALGTGLVSPLKITAAYAVFANGGYWQRPYFIERVLVENQPVYAAKPINLEQVIDPQNAYLITQVLEDAIIHGTGKAAKVLNRSDLAGKTGTTNDQIDAWFIGFNSKIVTAVWVGFDDLSSTHEYGAQAALPIWIEIMRAALAGTPESTMPQPPGIVTARIDTKTGLLAGSSDQNSMFEVFRQGQEPTERKKMSEESSEGEIF